MGRIGEQLEQARHAQGISLEDIQKITKIRLRYLEALEREDWGVFPEEVYLKGFLKSYAQALGLDAGEVLQWYQVSTRSKAPETASGDIKEEQPVPMVSRLAKPISSARLAPSRLARDYKPLPSHVPKWGIWLASCGLVVVLACSWLVFSAYRAAHPLTPAPSSSLTPPASVAPATTPPAAAISPASQTASGGSSVAVTLNKVKETSFEVRYEVKGVQKLEIKLQVKAALAGDAEYKCWTEVQSDGQNVGTAMMTSGKSDTFVGSETISVRLGNPTVMEATLNGVRVPPVTTADVVNLIFIRQP